MTEFVCENMVRIIINVLESSGERWPALEGSKTSEVVQERSFAVPQVLKVRLGSPVVPGARASTGAREREETPASEDDQDRKVGLQTALHSP